MKKRDILASLLVAAIVGSAAAQITVTNAVFPVAGDSLKTASDNDPQGITVTGPGGPFTWDYTSLNADSRFAVLFQAASEGEQFAEFPDAELVVIDEGVGETYYDVSATAVSALGIGGSGLAAGFGIEADLRYSPPLVELRAPLTFPNVFDDPISSLGIAFSIDQIPGDILDSLGVPTGLVDSIAIRFSIERTDFVDAYGTLAIPGGTYDVLREKRTDYTDVRIEIHTILGWQDITDLLGDFGGFGRDTSISYLYISNTEKEPIAVVTMDSTGLVPVTVDFKDNGAASAVSDAADSRVDVVVSPNPVTDVATFRLPDMLQGQYTLNVYDTNGRLMQRVRLTSDQTAVNLSRMPNGACVYRLTDSRGRVVAAGKLLKVAN